NDAERIFRGPEDIDHVDRLGDVGEPGVDALTEQLFPGMSGVHGDQGKTPFKEIFEGKIAWSNLIYRSPDHGDGLHGIEDAADVGIGIGVAVHRSKNAADAKRRW